MFLRKFSEAEVEVFETVCKVKFGLQNYDTASNAGFSKQDLDMLASNDYFVDLVNVKNAGITGSTGAVKLNELPEVLLELKGELDRTMVKSIKYSELINWSVSHNWDLSFYNLQTKYPNIQLASFLKKNRNTITIQNDENYSRLTIKINNNGIVLRDIKKGSQILTKRQYLVKGGQLGISKIDARNGAIGIIPENLSGAIVTSEFLTYDVNTDLMLPEYLEQVISTQTFVEFCKKFSSGTTNRQRLNEQLFLSATIPVPPIDEQRKMVMEIIKLRNLIATSEIRLSIERRNFEKQIFAV